MPENSDFYPQVMQRYPTQPLQADEHKDFIDALLRVFEEKVFNAREFDSFPIPLIVDYIQRTHIYYLEKKLPEIEQSIVLLSGQYESHHPILVALQNFFHQYVKDLSEHIHAEETTLLPYLGLLQEAHHSPAGFSRFLLSHSEYSVDRFLSEHHDTEDELKDIRQTIRLYEPPTTNESLYRILLSQLQTFEQDLRVHAHIEEEVLIPKAQAMEKALQNQLDSLIQRN
ncbi:MAG TPA: hemerythrin domain-containing protein [Puia sp.]|jgi:regulator of cell morphogenesis and NO signaling|nr:hemerythrin domain-containing protein [Puia sp.]